MKTPDFTPQALGAFLVLIFSNILILVGLDIGANREAALDTLLNAAAIVGFLVHDAVVRHGRAKVAAAAVSNSHPADAPSEHVADLKAGA